VNRCDRSPGTPHGGRLPVSSDVPDLVAALHRMEVLVVSRMRRVLEIDHRRVSAFINSIKCTGESLRAAEFLESRAKFVDDVKKPSGYRPSVRDGKGTRPARRALRRRSTREMGIVVRRRLLTGRSASGGQRPRSAEEMALAVVFDPFPDLRRATPPRPRRRQPRAPVCALRIAVRQGGDATSGS